MPSFKPEKDLVDARAMRAGGKGGPGAGRLANTPPSGNVGMPAMDTTEPVHAGGIHVDLASPPENASIPRSTFAGSTFSVSTRRPRADAAAEARHASAGAARNRDCRAPSVRTT